MNDISSHFSLYNKSPLVQLIISLLIVVGIWDVTVNIDVFVQEL